MYLSNLLIKNFRGIKEMALSFNRSINILIGENGSNKSAVIDAIRLLYNMGEPIRDISVGFADFHESIEKDTEGSLTITRADKITIVFQFKGLSALQKGALYEYMVIDPDDDTNEYAQVTLTYEDKGGKYPVSSYYTGNVEGQKSDYSTFAIFQHYYLSGLRDSTRDLLTNRGNVLGRVIKRRVEKNETEEVIEGIMRTANDELLAQAEVSETRDGVNDNLSGIYQRFKDNQIGLQIEQSKTEYIVNAIKPFLPHDRDTLAGDGFSLWQNSLGQNNLIYIATVLGDIKDQIKDNKVPHFALLIEEPEAHLHPQLQLSLYSFLRDSSKSKNSQLFITTHSPTLTSKVPLKNLILLDGQAFQLSKQFTNRVVEEIVEDSVKDKKLRHSDFRFRRRQLERYIDVTKSQLLFAKAILFVEGISEELLISAFTAIKKYRLEDYRIELVNIGGTSFYPFIHLFNSSQPHKSISKPVSILTDNDKYPDTKKKEFSFKKLIANNYEKLDELDNLIQAADVSSRIPNITSAINGKDTIRIFSAEKTLEYELALANIPNTKKGFENNFLFKYINKIRPKKAKAILDYVNAVIDEELTEEQQRKAAILLWKSFPAKGEFSQNFSLYILKNLKRARKEFVIPKYIRKSLKHLKG
ncbi:ATP-dependent nuclease [Candidatus Ulvibacter alkanivorans]|uniref:ATP-dependent nuclease n=1 Tax=Candidatus Ulvibacter alkanivorans TaxID=2267620 RepID=UPI000DF3A64E|nr:AAA family ATPase [Candidatus Ulvibacter alkanivorans]